MTAADDRDRPEGDGAPGDRDDDLGFEVPDDLSGLEALLGAPADEPAPAAGDEPDPDGAAPVAAPSTAAEEPSFEVPDDLSGLDSATAPGEPAEPVVAVVVTQVAGARALAAACSLAGVDVDAVPSPVGALAVLRDAADAARTAEAAAALSRMLRTSPVILLDRRGGKISASRWSAGEREDDLAAGLVLSGAPPVLEDVLIGGTPVGEVDGVETSVGMTRWAAMRALSAGGRRRKD